MTVWEIRNICTEKVMKKVSLKMTMDGWPFGILNTLPIRNSFRFHDISMIFLNYVEKSVCEVQSSSVAKILSFKYFF